MFETCFKTYSSLEKIMMDKLPMAEELRNISVLKNERFSFQIAYTFDPDYCTWFRYYPVKFEIKSPIAKYVKANKVGLVPSEYPLFMHPRTRDDSVISTKPGLYPDPLFPLEENVISPSQGIYDSLWFTVDTNGEVEAGTYDITIEFTCERKADRNPEEPVREVCQKTVTVEIIDALLPEQKTVCGQWFYCDCLMSYYKEEAFTERHWEIIENFLRTAHENGHNMILTPLFTPPLDTEIGGERPTVQLVDIKLDNGEYSFNFEKVDRWIDLCLEIGFKYFEMPHLFTQWGAKFCPKIMATVDGEYKRIFGWDIESTSDEYREFLSKFLPAVTDYMTKRGLKDNTFFHYSDEPKEHNIEDYKAAVSGAAKYLEGFRCMDALSNPRFYKENIIKNIIGCHYHYDELVAEGVEDAWIYYCCSHLDYFSNRFFAYPLWRTRIMGTQMFQYGINGFMTWGYNFYYLEKSLGAIDPYRVTDAGRAFPSGDAFSVYPGPNGECYESIRIVSFHEALQDIRALELLSDLIGRDKVKTLVNDIAGMEVKLDRYPANGFFIQALRRKVNELIKENINKK